MDLQAIREEIDSVDQELVRYLDKRMDLVSQVTDYKKATGKAVFDPEREQLLLAKIAETVPHEIYRSTILAIFSDILKHSRDYQNQSLSEADHADLS